MLVTGATSGVGEALVPALAERGASVLVHGRDAARVAELASTLPGATGFVADLASLAEVARFAEEVCAAGPLEVLVNNAGVGFGSDRKRREVSADGYELRFAVNYLAPFLLTELLGAQGLPSRAVVNLSSAGQAPIDRADLMSERNYDGTLAYRRSKLALIADTFQRAAQGGPRTFLTLHPGTFLATKMVREANITPQGTVASGVQAVLHVLDAALSGQTGRYFERESPAEPDVTASDSAAQDWLREQALRLTAPFRTG